MLLHYKTDGDGLSITGRMAGSDRGSKTPLLLRLVVRTGIDWQGSSGDLNVWGPRAEQQMSRGESSSFSGSFWQNQEYTKDTLGRCWGTDTGYTGERERVCASPFPSVMLSALYRPKPPQGLRVQPGHPVTALSWSRVSSSPGPDPHLPPGAAEHGQGAERVMDLVVLLPYP